MPADVKVIEEKVERGEELTQEEKEEIMGAPVVEGEVYDALSEEEKTGEKKPEAEKKEGKEKKAKESEEDTEEEEEEEEAEETPSEKDAEAAEAKEEEAEEPAPTEAERKKVIEAEAEKSLDEADISNYSPTERALFFELRRERRKRQDAQRESDVMKFQRAKEEEKRRAEAAKEDEESDPLKNLEDDDILTVGQIKKIMNSKGKAAEDTPAAPATDQRTQQILMENWILKGSQKHKDLVQVVAYADELLDGDMVAEAEVADVIRKGGNAALAVYNLIKSHPRWPQIEEKLKAGKGEKATDQKAKEEEARTNKERKERIEKNNKKTVTTGSGGGSAGTGEYTYQELVNMPDDEFAALPKSQREKILEKLG